MFWNGSEDNPAALLPAADSNYVQGAGGDQWAYSRWIGPMGVEDILRIDPHQLGILCRRLSIKELTMPSKGRHEVWYYYDGQWLKVAAGD